jgi:hypothetical protein
VDMIGMICYNLYGGMVFYLGINRSSKFERFLIHNTIDKGYIMTHNEIIIQTIAIVLLASVLIWYNSI